MALKFITDSCLFNFNDVDFFSRTLGAPTDSNRWTLSLWFKRSQNTSANHSNAETLFSAGTAATDNTVITFEADHSLRIHHTVASATVFDLKTAATFRDPTAWYHLVIRYNSDEGSDSDRVRIWVDNVQFSFFTTNNPPGSGVDAFINTAVAHEIGRAQGDADREFDGYISQFFFCDGQQLSPTDFGEFNSIGSWQPITQSVTFGANGAALEFATGANMGDDTSGNLNDWLENGIDATNQRDDTPSQNHVTFNPVHSSGNFAEVENGALELRATGSANSTFATAALPQTGKYYWEIDVVVAAAANRVFVGLGSQTASINSGPGDNNQSWGIRNSAGVVLASRHDSSDSVFTDTGTIQTGDFVQIAFDADTGKLWYGLNGTFLDGGDPAAGTGEHETITDALGDTLIPMGRSTIAGTIIAFRASAQDFEGTLPSGFRELRVDKWPSPPIPDPSLHFDIINYIGNLVTPRTLSGLSFTPGIVWIKSTDGVSDHLIADSVKGVGNIHSNDIAGADVSNNDGGEVSAFLPTGFTVINNANGNDVNDTGPDDRYIALCWNEDPVAGLDIVGYSGTGVAQNIAHNLGAVPNTLYVRNRDNAFENSLYVEHTTTAAGVDASPDPETDYLEMSTPFGRQDDATYWDDTKPDASNFRVGSADPTNRSGDTHIAYVWRDIEGFSKTTMMRGEGGILTRSPFIYCGFRPKVVFIKFAEFGIDNIGWRMFVRDENDNSGGSTGGGGTDSTEYFAPETDAGMVAGGTIIADMCASGFKVRLASNETSLTSEYLFMAWADIPFQFKSAFSTAANAGAALDINIEIDATGDDPNQFGDSANEITLLINATGSGGGGNFGDGALDFALQINATGTAPFTEAGAGALDLKLEIIATGLGGPLARGDGTPLLALEIDSLAFNTAIRGSPVLPQLTTVGVMEQSFDTSGDITLPQLVMGDVTILNANPIFGFPSIPVLQTSGEINPDFDVDLPALQATGTILAGTLVTGLVVLPLLQPSGTAVNPQFGEGNSLLPQLQTTGSTIAGGAAILAPTTDNLGRGAATLPALEANGFLLVPQELAGAAIALPALDIDPLSFIAAGSIGGGSVTLPLLRLVSVLDNGVTLTSTVWSMNTETLETTNYLNFDFVSLVSFADQPYGVTAGGIFLLEGDDDDGTDINARVLTGISDRGDESLKEAAHMYMQYDGGAMMFQLFPDGQQRLREYRFERRSNSSGVIHARAKGSRGLRSRAWQMGLRNLGGDDFTLDKLGLLLRKLVRKTRKN